MQLIVTSIPDLKIIVPKRHADARGWFRETWNAKTLARLGIEATFVQDNQARSLHGARCAACTSKSSRLRRAN